MHPVPRALVEVTVPPALVVEAAASAALAAIDERSAAVVEADGAGGFDVLGVIDAEAWVP